MGYLSTIALAATVIASGPAQADLVSFKCEKETLKFSVNIDTDGNRFTDDGNILSLFMTVSEANGFMIDSDKDLVHYSIDRSSLLYVAKYYTLSDEDRVKLTLANNGPEEHQRVANYANSLTLRKKPYKMLNGFKCYRVVLQF